MSAIVIAALLCLLAGGLIGLLGGGGSILAVPVLIHAAALEPRSAIVTSLLVVGTSSAVATGLHARAGRVDFRAGMSLGLASMIGAYGGGRLARFVPAGVLLAAFVVMMVVTALFMLRRRPAGAESSAARRSSLLAIPIGLGIGAVTGLVGAGGGFVIVPALVLLGGLPMRRAIGTSGLVIAMNSVAGFAGAVGAVAVDWRIAIIAAVAASTGSLAGVLLSSRVPASTLRAGFAWFVLAVSAFMVANQLPGAALTQLRAASSHVAAAASGALLVASLWLVLHLRGLAPRDHRTSSGASR